MGDNDLVADPSRRSERWASKWFTTTDGVRLHYLESGQGQTMLLLPGWTQTATTWANQINFFSSRFRVIAPEYRGHGESDEPNHGYRIARLAADIHDLVDFLALRDINWIAHSMGCAVTWSYWDLFGGNRIDRLVLVDQPAALVTGPTLPLHIAEPMGASFNESDISALIAGLCGADAATASQQLIEPMFTPQVSPPDLEEVTARSLAAPSRMHAALLMLDQASQNWGDVLPRIDVPTLAIGGDASIFASTAARWIAEQVPDGALRIFSESERGSHFSFWENPKLFNQTVDEFLRGNLSNERTLERS